MFVLEKAIIKVLLLYGNHSVAFKDFVANTNADGIDVIEEQIINNTVAKEIYLQLQEDEIEFTNELFKSIYYDMIHQLNQDEKINIDLFITHKSQDIAQVITDILMEDEKDVLSDWKRKHIFPKAKEDSLPQLVTDLVLNLRRILIEQKIKALQKEVQETPQKRLLEQVLNYIHLKKLLCEKLNRVV